MAEWCPVCPSAKELWRGLKDEHRFSYKEVDIASPQGEELVSKFNIMSVPTTVIGDRIAFAGVPDRGEAVKEVTK